MYYLNYSYSSIGKVPVLYSSERIEEDLKIPYQEENSVDLDDILDYF